jgi:rhodanese-related sulfurtransferase
MTIMNAIAWPHTRIKRPSIFSTFSNDWQTIIKTTMKKYYAIIAMVLMASGCMFQKPDYLKFINANELNQTMLSKDIFLVDVHTPEQQHINDTDLFIPYDQIEKYQDRFPKDKNTPIYLYCRSGPMANAAARSLHELGYNNLSNLDGGAKAWKEAGLVFE